MTLTGGSVELILSLTGEGPPASSNSACDGSVLVISISKLESVGLTSLTGVDPGSSAALVSRLSGRVTAYFSRTKSPYSLKPRPGGSSLTVSSLNGRETFSGSLSLMNGPSPDHLPILSNSTWSRGSSESLMGSLRYLRGIRCFLSNNRLALITNSGHSILFATAASALQNFHPLTGQQ